MACAEAADLDGDGDLDIAVCVFGDDDGKVVWLENKGGLSFEEHILDPRPGAIHAFPFDADGDGDLDLAVSLSQDSEEILLFRNGGGAVYTKEVLFKSDLQYYGMSGLELSDLDRDGDVDILFTNGDEGDGPLPEGVDPDEFHGLKWLENDGRGRFTVHEVVRHWGAYAVRAVDLDRDRDLDLVLSAVQIKDRYAEAERLPVIWLENDGAQNFTRHRVLGAPQQLITIDAADIDRDGVPEVLGGSYNDCVFVDPKCGPFGHRLVAFNIGVAARPALPTVGDTTVGKMMSGALAGGLALVSVGVALLRTGRRTRGRTRAVRSR